jgi:hypothetical protein
MINLGIQGACDEAMYQVCLSVVILVQKSLLAVVLVECNWLKQ